MSASIPKCDRNCVMLLRGGNQVVGVLNVESHELNAFAERDLQCSTLSAGNRIDNIQLLEEVRAANERLKNWID
ncbi:MAG: hypothetical protein U0559_05245 [Anaerolineae bacterium]